MADKIAEAEGTLVQLKYQLARLEAHDDSSPRTDSSSNHTKLTNSTRQRIRYLVLNRVKSVVGVVC